MKTLKYLFLLLTLLFPLSTFAEESQDKPVEWCIDNLATNYDIEATVHVQSMCEYPDIPILQPAIQQVILTHTEEKPKPQNITWYFETSKVNHGATTWTMSLNLNLTGATLNINKIQTWNKFNVVNSVTEDKKIIVTIKQFDDKRLDVECTNYELTIPKNALTTSNGDKNDEAITGNFIVENCPTNPQNTNDPSNPNNTNNPFFEATSGSGLTQDATFVGIIEKDEKGNFFINIGSLVFMIGLWIFFFIVFFSIFSFIKNSFIWKSWK